MCDVMDLSSVPDSLDSPARPFPASAGPFKALTKLIFTDFYRFFGLSWETSTFNDYHNTDDDCREFRYYHYMALIRALEELLRDLT